MCLPPFSDIGFGNDLGISRSSDGSATGSEAPVPGTVDKTGTTNHGAPEATASEDSGGDMGKPEHATACTVTTPGAATANGLALLGLVGLSLVGIRRRRVR
jgi:MYXO-CTERM domain-containing protein